MTTIAGYGSWASPLSAEQLAASSLRLSTGVISGGVAYWAEGHPEQRGRVSLWRRDADGQVAEITPAEANVRSAVNEYGGGEWTVCDGTVAYCSWPDGSVWVIEDGQTPRRIALVAGLRYACLHLELSRRVLLAVCEDHRGAGEPVQRIVALRLDNANDDGGRELVSGSDFYAHPSLSADGRLAWCEWNHPHLPWDQAAIMTAPVDDPLHRTVVLARDGVSALYPAWAPDDALIFLADESGYWNFHRWHDGHLTTVLSQPHDFCGPLWVLAPVPYSIIDAHRLGCTWLENGFARLGVLEFDGPHRQLHELATDAVSAEVFGAGPRGVALLGYPDRPSALVELDWLTGQTDQLRVASTASVPEQFVSRAEPICWNSPDGPVHAWFYPPTNPDYRAPDAEAPPVQVWSHGGPTAFSSPAFSLAVQYWTTRGIGILDVNYSGSSGYGRAYRQRLASQWGLSDVRDCADGALALVSAGRADRRRLSIRGSSAGGFTTLAALTGTEVFAAGISLYGIADLETLATDTHKFESHYTDWLVAPYPQQRQVYRERSPIHHLDQLSCPMLILQGADDSVVPPSQAYAIAAAAKAKGLPVRLRIFDGEGHGFRQASTIVAVAELSLQFLAEVHRFADGSL